MTTYTNVTRETNTWDAKTGISPITWDCGHKHRTLKGAFKCLEKHGNAGYAYHANIECSNGSKHDRMSAAFELGIYY